QAIRESRIVNPVVYIAVDKGEITLYPQVNAVLVKRNAFYLPMVFGIVIHHNQITLAARLGNTDKPIFIGKGCETRGISVSHTAHIQRDHAGAGRTEHALG